MKYPFKIVLILILASSTICHTTKAADSNTNQQDRMSDNPGVSWPAMDDLNRVLPMPDQAGPRKAGRFVGIFYFLWIGQHGPVELGPFDVSKIMAENPDALERPTCPPWGPEGAYHFWGEPLYGYYRSEDPWVIHRHANLLADAGVDTLIFDTTNAATYRSIYETVCKVFTQVRAEGGHTPQIAFMLNTNAGQTAQHIYEDLYKPGLYKDLWFYWKGKPLMLCDPEQTSEEVREFFTLRKAHWPFTQVNTPYAWHWEAIYPQVYGYTDDPNVPEQVNVSVAQNLRQYDGKVTAMSNGDARGRSFHNRALDTRPGAVNRGYNAQEQWSRALELDPPFVMVTGWNEWIAGRFKQPNLPVMFVDQFDQECSRDIEPANGKHGDNYYWQLIANIRRYKGMEALPKASEPKTIEIEGSFNQWQGVEPEYVDHDGEVQPRDHKGAGKTYYKNTTGRNELLVMKVARDAQNMYFYARTRGPLTPWSDPNWMMLLIDTDQNPKTGWHGFDYILNRNIESETKTVLEKNAGGWKWQKVAEVPCQIEGNELHIAVAKKALGLPEGNTSVSLDFKWVDNWQKPGDIMDFYLSGDVAPEGRFEYRYNGDSQQPIH
jgi:hypothetical protein